MQCEGQTDFVRYFPILVASNAQFIRYRDPEHSDRLTTRINDLPGTVGHFRSRNRKPMPQCVYRTSADDLIYQVTIEFCAKLKGFTETIDFEKTVTPIQNTRTVLEYIPSR
jgi:hypothetical protein